MTEPIEHVMISDARDADLTESLEAASRALRRTVEALDIGVSQTSASFGDVYEGLRTVARVSYNGRIWNLDGTEWKA